MCANLTTIDSGDLIKPCSGCFLVFVFFKLPFILKISRGVYFGCI